MKIHPLDLAIFGAYIITVLVIGALASRRAVRTKRDYFLAGDKLPWWMVGGSIVASNISSHHFVGVMGLAYSIGFAAMTVEWGAIIIGFNALLWIFLPYYLRNGFYTMPEFLERRFGRAARTTYAVLILFTYLFVEISAVLVLGALAMSTLFGLSAAWSVVVLAALTGITTIAGGLRAVVWTEMLQLGVLLLGGIVLSAVTLIEAGGPRSFLATSDEWRLLLPANHPDFPWTMFLGGIVSISIFYCAANQFIVQRVLAAKDEWHARMGVVFTDWLKLLLPLIIVVPGLTARRLYPALEKSDLAFPTLVRDLLPPGLSGLVLAGLIAAIMSHVSGALNSCSTILTIDFYLPWRKGATEAQAVRFGKAAAVVALLAGAFWALRLLAFTKRPMFIYLFDAYAYFAPGIATMFLFGTFWKKATHAGALAAGLLTIPLSVALQLCMPRTAGLARASIVFWACMLACLLVSLFTAAKPEAEIRSLLWSPASLRVPEGLRRRRGWLASPFLWWAIVTAIVLFFYVQYGILRMGEDMKTPWIPERQLASALERNEAFWRGDLDGGPLLWVTAADALPGLPAPPEPAAEEELWTDPGYVAAAAESALSRTHFAGDALPVFCPWLGPDQFAGWLGADLRLRPRESTSWSAPFVSDWSEQGDFRIDPANRWWTLYLTILRESARAGRDKWVTGYPDLHSGIDALSAVRGPENLAADLVREPDAIRRAMARMTDLWKQVVDAAGEVVLPAGQGTSNWTMGWSASRFLCIGQNDFTCMIGPEMFEEFCRRDTVECCRHADVSIYHLDGPGAARHVPALLGIEELDCIQWIQGAGRPLPSGWIPLLRDIQAEGKSVQVYYGGSHGGDADLEAEADALCSALDPDRLFIWAEARSAEEAAAVVAHARRAARRRRGVRP